MTRHTPLFVLVGSQLVVLTAALAFQLRIRGDLLALATSPEARARLALAAWLIPSSVAIGTAVCFIGLLTRRGRSRLRWLGSGLVVSALPSVAITLAVFAALLGP